MADRPSRVQTFRAHAHAVHNSTAAEHTERIVQRGQSLFSCSVTAICQEAVGLKQARRPNELVRVPPKGWTGGGAACAKNTLIQAVQLLPVFRCLKPLNSGRRRVIDQVWAYFLILLVEQRHVY